MTDPNTTNGTKATIREVYQLVEGVERRLSARLDRLEDRMASRTRWTVSTLVAAVAVVVAVVGVLVQ